MSSPDFVPTPAPHAPPRPGDLTPRWTFALGLMWALVAAAMAAVWLTTRQLGLSTWWLGPRENEHSVLLRLAHVLLPALVSILVFRAKPLSWLVGVVVGVALVASAAIDVDALFRIAATQALIGAVAVVGTAASFVGRYRTAPDTTTSHQSGR